MNSFIIAFNVVVPLCLLIAIGYFAKESKMVEKDAFRQMNKIISKIMIPTVLMKNIMETDLSIAFQPKLVALAVGGVLCICFLLWIFVPKFEKNRKRIGAMIQAFYRSNFVLFGLALAGNMYGSDNTAVTSILIAFCVPLYNIIAIIVLQYYGMESVDFKKVVKSLIKSPMLIGAACGFLILFLDIELPVFLKTTISDISKMTTPLALVVLGGTFEIQAVYKNLKQLLAITLGRLVVIPAVMLFLAVMMGFSGIELMSILVMFGSPVAVGSYAMAADMKCDDELTAQAILVTTVCSIFSMIIWISLLTSMQLL